MLLWHTYFSPTKTQPEAFQINTECTQDCKIFSYIAVSQKFYLIQTISSCANDTFRAIEKMIESDLGLGHLLRERSSFFLEKLAAVCQLVFQLTAPCTAACVGPVSLGWFSSAGIQAAQKKQIVCQCTGFALFLCGSQNRPQCMQWGRRLLRSFVMWGWGTNN